jgi:hypothetical protein
MWFNFLMTSSRTRAAQPAQSLTLGDVVIHPRTGRKVTLVQELDTEVDGLRRFFVQGINGGFYALVIHPSSLIATQH